jgi:hypothetical protein
MYQYDETVMARVRPRMILRIPNGYTPPRLFLKTAHGS